MKDNEIKFAPIPQNYSNQVKVYRKNYLDSGASFPNGFQKDVIQNAIGAKMFEKKWDGWKCDISVMKNSKGIFLVIDDQGTKGLTGKNRSVKEINEYMISGKRFPKEERLSRFSSMNNSGENTTGGGLYGIGKAVYSIASHDHIYYFDSVRSDDNEYIANINYDGQVLENGALEGKDAERFIKEHTGFDRKRTVGTRIIIPNPEQEIIDSINSGEMEKYIQESWWLLMERFPDSASITLNENRVEVPDYLSHIYKNQSVIISNGYVVAPGFKTKRFGFYIYDSVENTPWHGLSYYRKGMRIGAVDLNFVPKEIENRYWGFIEIEEPWEKAIAEFEDTVHFGISKGCRIYKEYQYLRKYAEDIVLHQKWIDWGYIKDKSNEDRVLNEELSEAAKKAQELFNKLAFPDLGQGKNKIFYSVRWLNFDYPSTPSREVTTGDCINARFKITSNYATDREFSYVVRTISDNPESWESFVVCQGKVELKPGESFEKGISIEIDEETAHIGTENRVVLHVESGNAKPFDNRKPFWYDTPEVVNPLEIDDLTGKCDYPNDGKRVNYGEAIKNISYTIANKHNEELKYCVRITMHYEDNSGELRQINGIPAVELHGILPPSITKETDIIEEIAFPEDVYHKFLTDDKGIVHVRAWLIADEANSTYERKQRITKFDFKIYVNCDEKNGKENDFIPKLVDAPDVKKRSYIEGNIIYINSKHKEFLYMKDISSDARKRYMSNQLLTQYVTLYLNNSQYDQFDYKGISFLSMDSIQQYDAIFTKIEQVLADSWE